MCWNADISLNTFIFAILALIFIYITNTYSKYKTPTFDNPLVYLFFFQVATIQLIEYFLWKNLKNKKWNVMLSKLALFTINTQVIILMFLIPQLFYRYAFLIWYLLCLIGYLYYKATYDPIIFNTTIGKNGHLAWDWLANNNFKPIFVIMALAFYVLPLYFINNIVLSLIIAITLPFSLWFYHNRTFGTMWCWISNFALLYFTVRVLFVLPFIEYNGRLC